MPKWNESRKCKVTTVWVGPLTKIEFSWSKNSLRGRIEFPESFTKKYNGQTAKRVYQSLNLFQFKSQKHLGTKIKFAIIILDRIKLLRLVTLMRIYFYQVIWVQIYQTAKRVKMLWKSITNLKRKLFKIQY